MRNSILLITVLGFLLSGCIGGRGDSTQVAPVVNPALTSDEFLKFFNEYFDTGVSATDSAAYANKYYETVDPAGQRTTLADWKALHNFDPQTVIHATFRDTRDLGYGRDMYAWQNAGDTLVYVDNYVVQLQPGDATTYGPLNLDAAINQDRRYHIGTNVIEFSADPNNNAWRIAKFFVFGPEDAVGVQPRLIKFDIDGRGEKYVPTMCAVCHGGTMYPLTTAGDFNAISLKSMKMHMLEQDSFQFSALAGFTEADQAPAIKAINRLVYEAFVHVGARPDDGISNDRANWNSTFAEERLTLAYEGDITNANTVYQDQQNRPLPAGWIGNDMLYQDAVEPHCIGCHALRGTQRNNAIAFGSKPAFDSYNDSIIRQVYQYGSHPRSLINYSQFWADTVSGPPAILAASLTGFPPHLDPATNPIVEPGKPVAVPGAKPVAAVGTDRHVNPTAVIRQDATASKFTSSYLWTVASNNATLDDNTSPAPVITPDAGATDIDLELQTSNAAVDCSIPSVNCSIPESLSITIDNTQPVNPTFSAHVSTILTNNCASCHSSLSNLQVVFEDTNADKYRDTLDRINLGDPEASLLLRKGTGTLGHPARLVDLGNNLTADYYTLLNWIRNGAPEL